MTQVVPLTLDASPADEHPWRRLQIQAPRGDETVLAQPPLDSAADWAERNHAALETANVNIQGRPLHLLRDWAREEACRAAHAYTSTWCAAAALPERPSRVFVGGHQPLLFHPGVWIKNFAVGGLARREGAIGLNLVVDNDTLTSASIRVPAGTPDAPHVLNVAFDAARPAQPWEEARILDRTVFDQFGAAIEQAIRPWGYEPLARQFWSAAVQHAQVSNTLADCLTAARNQFERRAGVENLELPISRMCQLDPFLWFASHLFAQIPRFHRIYNEVVHEYRKINKVRSRTHPVSDLRIDGDWLEAPFWVWNAGDHRRKPVFACVAEREILLADDLQAVFARLPLTAHGDACCAVKVLRTLHAAGIRLRTRALTTTLFARLCLADLFVHGIGGAKYDEMTDRIIARFFRIPAPTFLALSATVRLPLPAFSVDSVDVVRLAGLMRDLEFNPERHLGSPPPVAAASLIAEKRRLIAEQVESRKPATDRQRGRRDKRGGYARFQRFQQLNQELGQFTSNARQQLETELTEAHAQLAADAVLRNREYAFCLYPEDKLTRFFARLETGGGPG